MITAISDHDDLAIPILRVFSLQDYGYVWLRLPAAVAALRSSGLFLVSHPGWRVAQCPGAPDGAVSILRPAAAWDGGTQGPTESFLPEWILLNGPMILWISCLGCVVSRVDLAGFLSKATVENPNEKEKLADPSQRRVLLAGHDAHDTGYHSLMSPKTIGQPVGSPDQNHRAEVEDLAKQIVSLGGSPQRCCAVLQKVH